MMSGGLDRVSDEVTAALVLRFCISTLVPDILLERLRVRLVSPSRTT